MKKNYLICIIAVMLFAAFFNAAAVSVVFSSGNYFTCGGMILDSGTVRTADEMLQKYSYEDYPQALEYFISELDNTEKYRTAKEMLSGDFSAYITARRYTDSDKKTWAEDITKKNFLTDEQIRSKTAWLKYCIYRLEYAVDFDKFVDNAKESSAEIMSASFIEKDSFAYRNAAKAGMDFYKLSGVKVSAQSDMGILRLFDDRITDAVCVLTAAVCALLFYLNFKSEPMALLKKSSLYIVPAAVCAAIVPNYLFNMAAAEYFFGSGSLSRAVQSSEAFMSCAGLLNMGALIGIRIIFKTVFIAAVFLLVSGTLFSGKKSAAAIIAIIFSAQIYLYNFQDGGAAEINILSALCGEKIFGKYENLNILGNAVSVQNVFMIFTAAVFILICLFYGRQAGIFTAKTIEAEEKRYYDEVTRKQEEARQIRHDMSNHLRALSVLINSGDYASAEKYINEVSEEINSGKIPALLSRAAPDALIFSKIAQAERAGIEVFTDLRTDYGDRISDYDLCGIFGNLLDNAVRGMAENIPSCRRKIRLTACRRRDLLCIVCENPFDDGKINDNFETTKSDRSNHGYGLKRIKRIAVKYGGDMEISAENGIFTVTVLLSV